MSIFSLISGLFASSEALSQDVDDVVPRSSRAGKPQKCSLCGVTGHKSPSHKPDKVYALQLRVADLEYRLDEAESRAQQETDRADFAEGQARQLWAELDRVRQQMAELKDRLALAESVAQIGTYGEGTRI